MNFVYIEFVMTNMLMANMYKIMRLKQIASCILKYLKVLIMYAVTDLNAHAYLKFFLHNICRILVNTVTNVESSQIQSLASIFFVSPVINNYLEAWMAS